MKQTISKITSTGSCDGANRVLLQKWCQEAATGGGSFSIVTAWENNEWMTTYTINWNIGSGK